MGDLANKDKGEFTIVDPDNDSYEAHVSVIGGLWTHIVDSVDNTHLLMVNHDGSLNVVTARGNPDGTTVVVEGETATVVKNGGTDSYAWTIPSGETFQLQSMEFGGYFPSATVDPINAKVLLYYRPNGSGNVTGQELVGTIYLNYSSFFKLDFADETFTGDGTAVMEFEVTNWSKTDTELAYYMRGYY